MPTPTQGPHPHDDLIRKLRAEKMTTKAIAEKLGVHFWIVSDAFKRLNLCKPRPSSEKNIAYIKKPLVERKCPACQQKHWTTPETWTCTPCKEIEERENKAGCGAWYCG